MTDRFEIDPENGWVDTVVENAARAMYEDEWGGWDEATEHVRSTYRRRASAVAAAGLLHTEPVPAGDPDDIEWGIRHNDHVVIPCAESTAGHPQGVERAVWYGPWRPAPAADASVPRIWTEHDEEPPIGTVGRNRDGKVLWIRRADGWHCDGEGCRNCPAEWVEVVGWGGTLTEARLADTGKETDR